MTQTNSNYTQDEIQAAVTSLVLSSISYPVDTLGVRRTDLTFNDVQQAAANIFILYPNSPFYVLFLGCQRLNDQIVAEAGIIGQLLAALQAVGRKVLPVSDVSPLFNIQASLQALAGASRTSSISVTKAPAYQQFSSNLQAFLSGPGQSIKQNGAIVQTPAQARQVIPGLITELQQAHAQLLATVTTLANGIIDYNAIDLPSVVAESVLNNAAKLVGTDATALQALSPADRTAQIRQVVLNLLATNASVNTFGTFVGPSDFYSLEGLGTAYSDATHLAVPAELEAIDGTAVGIAVGVNDTLTVAPDGGAPFNVTLAPSHLAVVAGSAPGPYVISNATPNNDIFKLHVAGTAFTATLTLGTRTADQVAADIQAVLPVGAIAEGYFTPFDPLNKAVRIRLDATHLPTEDELDVFGNTVPSLGALHTLGFTNGQQDQCLKTTSDLVAKDISSKTNAITAGTSFVQASPLIATAHTDPTTPNRIVLSAAETTGDCTFIGTQVTYTVTAITIAGVASNGDTIALRSGPDAGHGYVIGTINGLPASNHQLAVGDVIVANGTFAGSASLAVDAEYGPTVTATKYTSIEVQGGPNAGTYFVSGPGATALDVLLIGNLPLVSQLPQTKPVTMTAAFGFLLLTLDSTNTTTSSKLIVSGNAATQFFGTATTTVLGTTPWMKLPSIPQGLQPGDLLEVYFSDYLTPNVIYPIVTVDTGLSLIEVSADGNTNQVIPDGSSFQFSPQPVPFARIRFGMQNDFNQVRAEMLAWLAASVNQPLFFQNFNATINPLLANSNPTAAQVGAATSLLEQFAAFITGAAALAIDQDPAQALDSIVASFTIESVPAIDNLIQAFIEKGSDRATDLLLQGLFSTFFGLSADEVSYAGAFQAATKAVAMSDLPISRFNRPEALTSRLKSQAQSPDLEFPASSTTETIPGAAGQTPAAPTDFGTPSEFATTTGSVGSGNQ